MALQSVNLSNKDRALLYTLLAGQETILGMLQDLNAQISQEEEQIMAQFDDVEMKLQAETDAGDMLKMVVETFHQELVDLVAIGATPARVQALADKIDAKTQAWVAAAQANPDPTAPASPPPTP